MKLNKKQKTVVFIAVILFIGLSLFPLFIDPWHSQEEPVNFWTWTYREIWELIYGEKPHDPQYP